jgi:ABC-type branched-subunit amino acid transport system ATPase component/sugar phosphate permease
MSVKDDPAALAAAVLEEEARRQEEEEARSKRPVLPDDLLPGVGGTPLSLREGIRAGGWSMVVILFLLNVIDELPRTIRVLAPDIQQTLGISDTVLLGVLGFGGVTLVLGAVPMAAIADRVKRVALIPVATFAWAITTFLSGLVVNAFQLFLTNAATGLGMAYRIPVSNSLLADTYPIKARSRIFAFEGLGRPVGQLTGPLLVGGIATAVGGTEGWRWAFFVVAIPPVIVGLVSLVLKEPPRGRFEQEAVFGHTIDGAAELPVSISTAFARLKKVRTFYYLCVGVGVLGFALIAIPVQFNLLLEDQYGYDALERGIIESLVWLLSLAALPIAGRQFDKRFRADPPSMMRLCGYLVGAAGIVYLIGLRFTPIVALVLALGIAQACISGAFVAAPSIIAAVAPYRIRAQAFALLPVFVFLMGGFLGGLIVGQISDAYGHRTAMTVVAPPAALLAGALIVYGSRFLRADISLAVEELLEEQEEVARMNADPGSVPLLQVRNLDFSYGPVQVLFDVGLEVQEGEVLALLGTNGAGKSTLLRAISGLGIPDRGVVRLRGRTITYAEAEARFAAGIVQLRGGAGVFPDLTVAENLRAALLASDLAREDVAARTAKALDAFPALRNRLDERARNLSGGQQQMLALGMALMHEPEILIIDELSLGLAPVVMQELLAVVEDLKARGQTMIIVEQSLNVALAIADRAIFMEKGRVRFEGSAQELLERDDLARAVFLGGEGG